MKNTILNILPVLFLFFMSCEKELNINIPRSSHKIVVNSKIFEDSLFVANVYRTSLINENSENLAYIDSAKVSLYSDEVFIETLQLKEFGNYIGQHRVMPNTNYKIKVEVDGFATATAQTQTLHKVEILKLDSLGLSVDPETKERYYKFAVHFKDNEKSKDYYMIDFTEDGEIGSQNSVIYSKDPAIEVGGGNFMHSDETTTYGRMYFSDDLFNGDEYAFSIYVPENEIYGGFTVNLCHITYEYFKYVQTYSAQNEGDGLEMFFQAVQVYNNVHNGLGIFGAISSYTQSYEYNKVR